jgi:choline dehydrogenase-like flavoprotein
MTAADVTCDVRVECDVVIVGSGAGGATMAAELSAAGMDVVVVEEGGYHPTESFGSAYAHGLRTLYRDGGASAAIGTPPMLYSEGRCVGGSTVVNGGMSFRTPEEVLQRWSREVSAVGPQDMAPHFAAVERRLHVAYQDPETIGRDSQLLKAGADAKGWHIIANTRNQIHCAGTNNCVLGCPTGAKRSMLLTNVPRALARGARVFANCRVDRVTRDGRTATGIEGRFATVDGHPRGYRLCVRAKLVVIAGGAVQTPALLMRSGFRSPSGLLGRELSMHPNAKVVALFDQDVRGWHGVHQAFQVREFSAEGILITAVNIPPALIAMGVPDHGAALGALMRDYDRMVTAGCLVEDTSRGRVRNVPGLGAQVFYQINDADAATIVRGVALTAELMFAAGARRILSPFAGVPDLTSMDDVTALRSGRVPKRSIELFTVHLMGSARMSDDPARGVTSGYGEFHGARNLFVADASLFPGPIGVNPMLTISALVTRNAAWLVENRSRYGI